MGDSHFATHTIHLLRYARLEDDNTVVRKNALMVVSHLVLNDMIKLSGHAHTLAKRLEDSDARIADFAKLFFSEFHQKGDNNLYVSVSTMWGVVDHSHHWAQCRAIG